MPTVTAVGVTPGALAVLPEAPEPAVDVPVDDLVLLLLQAATPIAITIASDTATRLRTKTPLETAPPRRPRLSGLYGIVGPESTSVQGDKADDFLALFAAG
jgi:hypothetical protein